MVGLLPAWMIPEDERVLRARGAEGGAMGIRREEVEVGQEQRVPMARRFTAALASKAG